MNWIIPFIVGWCGTGWPWRIPIPPGGGGGGGDPGDPWPGCTVCGGILGGIAAIVFEILLARQLADVGFGGHLAVDFFVGSFAVSLIGGVVAIATGKRTVNRR